MNAPTAADWLLSLTPILERFRAEDAALCEAHVEVYYARQDELERLRDELDAHFRREPDEYPRTSAGCAGFADTAERLWRRIEELK